MIHHRIYPLIEEEEFLYGIDSNDLWPTITVHALAGYKSINVSLILPWKSYFRWTDWPHLRYFRIFTLSLTEDWIPDNWGRMDRWNGWMLFFLASLLPLSFPMIVETDNWSIRSLAEGKLSLCRSIGNRGCMLTNWTRGGKKTSPTFFYSSLYH